MPTLLLTDGFRFFFYSNEGNEPPHVHVEYAEGTAKFWLQPVALVEQHQVAFLEKWNEYFSS